MTHANTTDKETEAAREAAAKACGAFLSHIKRADITNDEVVIAARMVVEQFAEDYL